MDNRTIENKLSAIRTAKSHLLDAEKQLESVLFDRVPVGRIQSTLCFASDSVTAARFNLKRAK